MKVDNNKSIKKIENDGYPSYPEKEDIYYNAIEEVDLDPENILKKKTSNKESRTGISGEVSLNEIMTGEDLDIPGAELDDEMENVGSEDEENNFYSVGGDSHTDLEETKS